MLTPSSEVLLSYLTGLAPVGETFEPRLEWMMADLGYRQKVSIYRCLGELIRGGCVKKLTPGAKGTVGVLIVAIRLEQMTERSNPEADCYEQWVLEAEDPGNDNAEPIRSWRYDRVSAEDWSARLAEMPDDTRDLTARVLGDPIPNDPRRRRLGGARKRAVSLRTARKAGALESERKATA